MTWKFTGSSPDNSPFHISGIDVWKYQWNSVAPSTVDVIDPLYGQRFRFRVYEVVGEGKSVRFAAGEFSNGVWGFYSED